MQVQNWVILLKKVLILTLKKYLSNKSNSNRDCGNVYNYLKLVLCIVLSLCVLWISMWINCGQIVDNYIF